MKGKQMIHFRERKNRTNEKLNDNIKMPNKIYVQVIVYNGNQLMINDI